MKSKYQILRDKLCDLKTFIKHRRFGLPGMIGIETATACNRRCSYCPQSAEPMKQDIISDEVWNKVVSRIEEYGWIGPVALTRYNELSLVPNSARFVADVKKIGALPYVFTNGDRPEVILEWLEAGAHRIVVTEHEVTKVSPKKPQWLPCIMAIKRRYPFRVQLQRLKPENMHTHIGLVKVEGHQVQQCFSDGLTIDYKGNVMLCCLDYRRTHEFGNIMDKSIDEIWTEPTFKMLREEPRRGNPILEICKKCLSS